MISVVIPTLNAAEGLPRTLAALVPAAFEGLVVQVVVSDGGSSDATCAIADDAGADIVAAPRGRGSQLMAGAAAARAPWLLFLHADTVLAPDWTDAARNFIRAGDGMRAAAFRFAFDDPSPAARFVEAMVALRCAALRLPYGDQGLLISRSLHETIGGYRPYPLMEDVDMVRRIGRRRLSILPARAVTSAAKYRRDGWLRRTSRNLLLVTRYFAGASPESLARRYR